MKTGKVQIKRDISEVYFRYAAKREEHATFMWDINELYIIGRFKKSRKEKLLCDL